MGIEIIFFTQLVVTILMFIFLHKITHMKKQIEEIKKEVEDYLAFLAEDVDTSVENSPKGQVERNCIFESQNGLIQSVLQDFFP